RIGNGALRNLVHVLLPGLGAKTNASAEVSQITRPDVRGHDNDGIAEVHLAAQAVGQDTVVQHLQQQVVHVGVRLLNLVEQDNR
nr:hypothetical protein [Tanacetum cinerariifolium]